MSILDACNEHAAGVPDANGIVVGSGGKCAMNWVQ